MNLSKSYKQKGFTLLEVLLVVAIIAILAAIVILAINPGKNLEDSRNAQRRVDVNTILNAVYQYSLDNSGDLPTDPDATATEICKTGVLAATCTTDSLDNLSVLTTSETYLTALPQDPQCGVAGVCATNGIGYRILKSANGRITVDAPDAEGGAVISVTR